MLSVVIPAYNEEKTIFKCLDSLVTQKTSQKFETIVVDNNSTDKTSKVAQQYKNRLDLKIVVEKKKGRGAARSLGFKTAKGEIILSTDADTIVPPNWIEKITQPFVDDSIIAVTGPFRINDCPKFTNMFFNLFQPTIMVLYRVAFNHYWLSGFNFAIRKQIYEKSGGFDTSLNVQEDIELSFKVGKLGKIIFLKNLPVVCSGRRFKHKPFQESLPYLKTFIDYFLFKKKDVFLSDIR